MQKKVLAVAAVLALFVCGGAFAQEAEATSGGSLPMYVGLEMGYGSIPHLSVSGGTGISGYFGGFEIVPVFGIAPLSKLPDLAFEFNLMMDFVQLKHNESTIDVSVISPQVLAVYTFCEGPVRPFLGAGFGVNINPAKFSGGGASLQYDLGASFSVVTKGGVVARIPNTRFDVQLLLRHNLNVSSKFSLSGASVDVPPMNLSSLSFVAGGRFHL